MKVKTGTIAALIVACAIAIWMAIGRKTAAEAVYPVENGVGIFRRCIVVPLSGLWSRPRLAADNLRLKEEISVLRMRMADYDLLAAENSGLRKALDFERRNPGKWIAAPVLSRGGVLGTGDVLRLGKGSIAGVCKGAAVASPEGLVGRVSEVSPHTAEVRLITDPSLKVACEVVPAVAGARAVFGILSGGRLMHLDRDLAVPERAKIVTSGLGGVYPRGIVVGFLANGTHEDETQLEREGAVTPAVDFAALENVLIHREE